MKVPGTRYDVVIAGARCAGAATAMLLARSGLRVLVVDPTRPGSDTLSTHALMRGAIEQLDRWGLLERIRAAGTPPIRTTTFQYGREEVRIPIGERNGVDALYAPRRTVLDPVLQDAARAAGAHVVHRAAVIDLMFEDGRRAVRARPPGRGGSMDDRSRSGADGGRDGRLAEGERRVTGAVVRAAHGATVRIPARWVIGADGIRSRIARLVDAPLDYRAMHATSTVYGYWHDPGFDGYRWHYSPGLGVGVIPTNDDLACVFASASAARFRERRDEPLSDVHTRLLTACAPELLDALASTRGDTPPRLRAFAGMPGFLRRSAGPGWALVGDAGYFRDPLTAHGITDALRDAELLAHAVVEAIGGARDEAMGAYQATRDALVLPFLEVTDRIASFDWDLDTIQALHLELSRQMKRQAALARERAWMPRAPGGQASPVLTLP